MARSPSPRRSRSRTPHVQISAPTLRRNQRCYNLAAMDTKHSLVGNNNVYRGYRPTRMYHPTKTVYVSKKGYGYRPWPQHSVSAQVRNHQRTSLEPTFNGYLVVQLNCLQLSGNCYDKRRGNYILNRWTGLPSPMEMQQLWRKSPAYIPISFWVTAQTKKIKVAAESLKEQVTKMMKIIEEQEDKLVCGCGEKNIDVWDVKTLDTSIGKIDSRWKK